MQDRRRAARYGVQIQGLIRGEDGVERAVAISNLSVEGCRLNVPGRHLAAGTMLTIGVGPVGLLHAHVAWRVGAVHGVSFDQPLHPAVLDHIRLFLSTEPAVIEERRSA
uniref:PilZ domain-containing protein n=1 Tax=Altererythrobacter segetis TaxID=1104773 RepID=UPI00140D75E6|nr:PilZ domain-containing protein [Altererythrobacter segetis]